MFVCEAFSLGFVTTLSCLGGFRGECVPCCCLCTEAAIAPMAVAAAAAAAAAASAASAAFTAAVLLLLLLRLLLLLLRLLLLRPLLLFPLLPSFQRWHGHCARMRRKSQEANRPSPLTFPPRCFLRDFVSAEGGSAVFFLNRRVLRFFAWKKFVVSRPSGFASLCGARAYFSRYPVIGFLIFICYCFSIGASCDFSLGKLCGQSAFRFFAFISCAGVFLRYAVFGFLFFICYCFSLGASYEFLFEKFCGESIFGVFVFISCAGIFPRYLVFGFLIFICYRFFNRGGYRFGYFCSMGF